MLINSTIRAIDPHDCGCTECMTGQYVPLYRATDDHVQAVFLGIIGDNTSVKWNIKQTDDGRFQIATVDPWDRNDVPTFTFTIDKIAFPIAVENYVLDVDLDTVIENLVHLRP